MTVRSKNLDLVVQALVASRIQVAIFTKLPDGIDVKIGDEQRGPVASKTFKPADIAEVTPWLIKAARNHYPRSGFAHIEWANA